ncbi:hypothetical protein Aph01nite_34520 [Acrocarpospora phusangensis]|uniref:Uncharacterized protein n=1 Tax=Acrocarpospora phusangensis TaxID=1070424 RepID=A0A919UP14_9ACTN|nr:hypothetical protein [Acrocarpospora phusangensis]GIH25142.1 hypothetical protein Aph01nite_34520 [Acrocarpospora phusangensis]
MTSLTQSERRHDIWTTIAVTALPAGWRNAFTDDDDDDADGSLFINPCPAILLQECRAVRVLNEIPGGDVFRYEPRIELKDSPYETRAVFADNDQGELRPVADISNYAGTYAPDAELPTAPQAPETSGVRKQQAVDITEFSLDKTPDVLKKLCAAVGGDWDAFLAEIRDPACDRSMSDAVLEITGHVQHSVDQLRAWAAWLKSGS